MNFASDNNAGVCPEVMAALAAEADRSDAAYGLDAVSLRLEGTLGEVFEHEVAVYPVSTGTAANAIALAAVNPVWGAVLCHSAAHVQVDECAAPTVVGSGLTLVPVDTPHARLTPAAVDELLDTRRDSGVHTAPVTGLTLTNVTEAGTRYSPAEVAALAEPSRRRGMRVHLDGARFANAVASAGASPAELTWRAGVDLMSFGATKGGAMAAEAVVVFADDLRDRADEALSRLRKRTGHLVSKQRFLAAQFEGWLGGGTWLHHADHANAMAARLGEELVGLGVEPAHPVEANMVFAVFDRRQMEAARTAGAEFYTEAVPGEPELVEARLVTSWSTSPADLDALVAAVAAVAR